MKQITFSLEDEAFSKIEKMCQEENRSKASLIRHIVFKKIQETNGTTN